MKKFKLFIFCLFLILCSFSVTALTLGSGTILRSNAINAQITFDAPITVSQAIVNTTGIYLYDFANGDCTFTLFSYTAQNSVALSSSYDFCIATPPEGDDTEIENPSTGGGGSRHFGGTASVIDASQNESDDRYWLDLSNLEFPNLDFTGFSIENVGSKDSWVQNHPAEIVCLVLLLVLLWFLFKK